MDQRWTYRCYPTPEQQQALSRTFGCCRYVYNWALAERSRAFKEGQRMSYADSDRAMTVLKRQPETAWLNEVSSVPLQQALRQLQTAFSNFFAKRTRYPSFRCKGQNDTAAYTLSAFKLDRKNRTLSFAKIGRMKVRWDRPVPSAPTTATIIRKPSGRWFVSLVVKVDVESLPMTGAEVGIDFGINRLATLSTGERVGNPRHLATRARRLAKAQRQLARKQKGSRRRLLAKRRVARIHEKIGNCRKDTAEKLAIDLVRRFDVIHLEDLNLRGMVKNHSLARSLSDVGIGMAVRTIERKAAMYGKTTVKVDRWFPSSKMCSCCGRIVDSMPLSIREWTCKACGSTHDRDDNAAKNILAAGQAVTARGGHVRAAVPLGAEAGDL